MVRENRACLTSLPAAVVALACLCLASGARAQQPGSGAQQPTPADVVGDGRGHIIISGGGLPTVSNVTLLDGSTDNIGQFTGTNTSGSITFAVPYLRPPICDLNSQTTTAAAWNTTNTQIVLTTIVSGTTYTYQCFARAGG